MSDPVMLGWLRLTGAVEVVQGEGIRDLRTMHVEDQWEVWVTNGGTGEAREGTRLAVCASEQDAELVAYTLRLQQSVRGPL